MIKNKKELVNQILNLIMMAGIVYILLLLATSALYSYPAEDDFSFMGGAKDALSEHGSYLAGAWYRAYNYYKTNQGTWLFNFLVHYIVPYTRWGMPGYHLAVLFADALFVFSLWFFIKNVIKPTSIRLFYMLVAMLSVFCVSGTLEGMELFQWHTGTLNFTIELGFMFMSSGLLLRQIYNKDKESFLLIIPASLLAILAGGGTLEVAAINCTINLSIVLFFWRRVWKQKYLISVFVSSLAGALVNAMAPGNFERAARSASEGHNSMIDAIKDTFICYKDKSLSLLSDSLFLFILLSVFVIIFLFCKKHSEIRITGAQFLIAVFSSFMIKILTIFPVVWGEHMPVLSGMRTSSTYNIIAHLSYVFIVSCLAIYLCKLKLSELVPISCAVIVFVCVCSLTHSWGKIITNFTNSYCGCVIHDINNESMRDNYLSKDYIINTLQLAPDGSDVVLWPPLYQSYSKYGMGLGDSPEWFENQSAANLYDLKSITIFYQEME